MEPFMLRNKSFARFITFPENELAFLAVSDLLSHLRSGKSHHAQGVLSRQGPSGREKSHFVSGLAAEVANSSGHPFQLVAASDFREPISGSRASEAPPKKQLAAHEASRVPFSLVHD